MSECLDKFKKILQSVYEESGPHEATFDLLKDLAKNNAEIVGWIKQSFNSETDIEKKGDLARIAISVGEMDPYSGFLKHFHGWTDADF